MDEQEIRKSLRAWLVQRGNVTAADLKDDSSLVSDGIINSLDIFELIAYLEVLSQAPLNMQSLKGDEFQSIDTLIRSFFAGAA